MKLNKKKLLEKSLSNIEDDRNYANICINQLLLYIKGDGEKHKATGLVLSKYLEVLQRSNEQLVKISSMLKEEVEEEKLSETDKENIYENIGN